MRKRTDVKSERYPEETFEDDDVDDGTMPANVRNLAEAVVGHRIVAVHENAKAPASEWAHPEYRRGGLSLTLDDGRRVFLIDTSDCCASTELAGVVTHLDKINHIIMGVGTTEGYSKWHIYADLGDVLELSVSWSAGNPFYYGYGFDIVVWDPLTNKVIDK